MDKIMSTRMDEDVLRHIAVLANKLKISKKAVLANAVRCYVEKIAAEKGFDVLTETCGCWQRDESAAQTVGAIKRTMRHAQERYRR